MELSSHLHAPAALPPETDASVSIEWAAWGLEPIRTLWRGYKFRALPGIEQILDFILAKNKEIQ
jgi:hypothetical protein